MKDRDIRNRKYFQILIDKQLWIKFKLICIDLDITPSEYIEKLVERVIKEGERFK